MRQNSSTLKSKLRNYSILAGSALAAASTADGQIVYHDIKPDTVLNTNGATYIFDLNGDGTMDFIFKKIVQPNTVFAAFDFRNKSASFEGSLYTFTSGTKGTRIAYPYVVNSGDKIGSSGKWLNFSAVKFGTMSTFYYANLAVSFKSQFFGNWGNGDTAKFVGLRIKSDTVFNYGWVRCTITPGGQSITVMDYAYQSLPDSSIIAGDTGAITGISTHLLQNVSVYSSGKKVIVKYQDAREGMTILVRDMLGKEMQAVQTTNEVYEMNLSDAAAGVYTVTVRSKNAELTKKVSIQ